MDSASQGDGVASWVSMESICGILTLPRSLDFLATADIAQQTIVVVQQYLPSPTVTRKSDHLFTAKNIKTASEILKTQLFFDLKFKSLFYKNDRKQPDLWSYL